MHVMHLKGQHVDDKKAIHSHSMLSTYTPHQFSSQLHRNKECQVVLQGMQTLFLVLRYEESFFPRTRMSTTYHRRKWSDSLVVGTHMHLTGVQTSMATSNNADFRRAKRKLHIIEQTVRQIYLGFTACLIKMERTSQRW